MDILERINRSSVDEGSSDLYCRLIDCKIEIERLRAAIRQTLDENGHLADGEDCTLRLLKKVSKIK